MRSVTLFDINPELVDLIVLDLILHHSRLILHIHFKISPKSLFLNTKQNENKQRTESNLNQDVSSPYS